jgi:hypothetical protein
MHDTLISPAPTEPAAPSRSKRAAVPPGAAWLMALGSFLSLTGFAWDLQWHGEVGPDTFFTVPHLFIYAGSAVVGLVCLVMSLRILNAERLAGDALSLRTIPLPYLIAGFGTAIFLACGLWDEWWHSIYGFDVTIMSPPHIGLLTCIQIGMVGTIVAFASAPQRPDDLPSGPSGASALRPLLRSRTLGITVVTGLSVSFLIFFSGLAGFLPLEGIGIQTDRVYLGVAFSLAFLFAASAARVRFAATSVAVVVVALKLLMGWFTIVANDWYANLLGLFLRDEVVADLANRSSQFSGSLPTVWVVLLAALAVDIVLLVGARLSVGSEARAGRLSVVIAGGLSGILMSFYFTGSAIERLGFPAVTPGTVIALGVAGSLAGLVAWQLGNIARADRRVQTERISS